MYNRIELIDKLIKIPANKEKLVMHEDNTDIFIVRIPRYLLTDDLTKSKVFILAQSTAMESNIIVKELEFFFDDEDYIEYLWNVTKEYTAIEGELIIQFKIIRDNSFGTEIPPEPEDPDIPDVPLEPDTPDVPDIPDEPDPENPLPVIPDETENLMAREGTPPSQDGKPTEGSEQPPITDGDSEGKETEEKPKEDLSDLDPDMNVSTNTNQDSIWYSYQNIFKIVKVLNPLV